MHLEKQPRRGLWLILALVSAMVATGPLEAQTQQSGANSRGHGYTFEAQNGWVLGQGYRPIRLNLRSGKVATQDREYTIEIENQDPYRHKTTRTTATLVIPSGARSGSQLVSVPQTEMWLQQSFKIYEGGRHLDKLDTWGSNSGNLWNYGGGVTLPTFLCISDRTVDTALLTEALAMGQSTQNNPGTYSNLTTSTINGRAQYPAEMFLQIPLAGLPTGWLDYSSPDVICLSVDDLVKLADTQPETLQAICQATSAGGNLWIWGAGGNWERLREIEARTGLWGPHAEDWYDPNPSDFARGLDGAFTASRSVDYTQQWAGAPATAAIEETTGPATNLSPPEVAPFRLRKAQLGMVLVFSGNQPIGLNPPPKADVANFVWAVNSVGSQRLLNKKRQGASMTDDNPDFWKLMIPGVGKAPVTAFRVLITVFVLAIGPVNYYWLRRKGKLHLLLAVVPITAIVVTASLFAYALATDGLHVRVRQRSFTSIDQARQQAVCWARITYYAGLSPASGLQFDDDTAVLPIEPRASSSYSMRYRDLEWEGDRQRFTNGWLYSRTPTQFLTIRTRPTTNGLRITPGEGEAPPAVTNGLGTKILHLVMCDEQGRLYKADETARGAACKLAEIGAHDELPELTRYFVERAAVQLPDMQLTESSYNTFNMGSYYYGQSTFTPQQGDSLLEDALTRSAAAFRLPSAMQPRNYLAIVEQSPEIDYGLEAPQQELPVHVIHGTW